MRGRRPAADSRADDRRPRILWHWNPKFVRLKASALAKFFVKNNRSGPAQGYLSRRMASCRPIQYRLYWLLCSHDRMDIGTVHPGVTRSPPMCFVSAYRYGKASFSRMLHLWSCREVSESKILFLLNVRTLSRTLGDQLFCSVCYAWI